MMKTWKIVFVNQNNSTIKNVLFSGSYREARQTASKLLYSDNCYHGYRVELV